jgi:hypothetical protein
MRITNTTGNAKNGIKSSRVSVYTDHGTLVDRFDAPRRNGIAYCREFPNGKVGQRFMSAVEKATFLDSNMSAEMAVVVSNIFGKGV